MKNTLSKTENISNKSKDVFQNIQNTLSEIREDRTSTPEPISSRLRSKGRTFAPPKARTMPSWNLEDPENLQESSDLEDSS